MLRIHLAWICSLPAWRYRVPPEALHDGFNAVEMRAQAALKVTWVEIALAPAASHGLSSQVMPDGVHLTAGGNLTVALAVIGGLGEWIRNQRVSQAEDTGHG